jgi:hypothetical protein
MEIKRGQKYFIRVIDMDAGYTGMKTEKSVIKASIISTNHTVDGKDGLNPGPKYSISIIKMGNLMVSGLIGMRKE